MKAEFFSEPVLALKICLESLNAISVALTPFTTIAEMLKELGDTKFMIAVPVPRVSC